MAVTLQNVDIYTQALNAAFINAREFPQKPYPVEKAIQIVPSKGETENFPWMYPPPLMSLWNGFRNFAKIGATNYKVRNLTFTAQFEVPKENWDDEQVGGFAQKGGEMANAAHQWRVIDSLVNLSLGNTTLAFDQNYLFVARTDRVNNAVGTYTNWLTAPTAGTDGVTHVMILMYHARAVKPLIWTNREEVDFRTDMGDNIASLNRMYRFWSDLRGAPAYGFPFDFCAVFFGNTPTLIEVQTAIGLALAQMKTYLYPKALPSDVNQYFHHMLEFDSKSVMAICSSKIEYLVKQAATLTLIAQTENPWLNFAEVIASGYFDAMVHP